MKPLKVVQNAGVLYMFTSKCASRYSSVHFFHIWTSKSGPYPSVFWHFDFKMCFSLQRRAIFPHLNFKKWSEPGVFCTFWLENVLRRFTEVTFRPSPPTNHWKTQHFATSLTFRACGSSFYWLSRNCIFFLLTLLLCSAVSSSDSAALLCFFNCPYCRKLDF